MPTLYQRILGASFTDLHPILQHFHASPRASATGTFRVTHGPGRLGRFFALLLRVPPEGEAVRVLLGVRPAGRGESWVRSFDGSPFVTTQTAAGGLLWERSGPLAFGFALDAADGGLTFVTRRATLMGLPLPAWAAPDVSARVEADGEGWAVCVRLSLPLAGQILEYRGAVVPSCT